MSDLNLKTEYYEETQDIKKNDQEDWIEGVAIRPLNAVQYKFLKKDQSLC